MESTLVVAFDLVGAVREVLKEVAEAEETDAARIPRRRQGPSCRVDV